jgi:predicted dinucleotide-binding enzyme
VPWEAMGDTLSRLGELNGRVVVDVSYPYRKQEREALKGSSTVSRSRSGCQRARVCKGWNHVHARDLTAPEVNGVGPLRVLSPS